MAEVLGRGTRRGVGRDRGVGQVLPGAEATAGAREHEAAHACVLRGKVQRRHQFGMQFGREAVERRGAIEAQRADRAGIAGEN